MNESGVTNLMPLLNSMFGAANYKVQIWEVFEQDAGWELQQSKLKCSDWVLDVLFWADHLFSGWKISIRAEIVSEPYQIMGGKGGNRVFGKSEDELF